jgi:hypothetical protein
MGTAWNVGCARRRLDRLLPHGSDDPRTPANPRRRVASGGRKDRANNRPEIAAPSPRSRAPSGARFAPSTVRNATSRRPVTPDLMSTIGGPNVNTLIVFVLTGLLLTFVPPLKRATDFNPRSWLQWVILFVGGVRDLVGILGGANLRAFGKYLIKPRGQLADRWTWSRACSSRQPCAW